MTNQVMFPAQAKELLQTAKGATANSREGATKNSWEGATNNRELLQTEDT